MAMRKGVEEEKEAKEGRRDERGVSSRFRGFSGSHSIGPAVERRSDG